jgi:hypothetical protein
MRVVTASARCRSTNVNSSSIDIIAFPVETRIYPRSGIVEYRNSYVFIPNVLKP